MNETWQIRFTVEWDDDGVVHYCACAYNEDDDILRGWSALTLTALFDLIQQSAERVNK